MEPVCLLDVVYSADGLEDFMSYNNSTNQLTVNGATARSGIYELAIQAYIEEQDITGREVFELEIIMVETYTEESTA